jgi:hypothetical protein
MIFEMWQPFLTIIGYSYLDIFRFCSFMAVFFCLLLFFVRAPAPLSLRSQALVRFWRQSRRPKPCRCTALYGLAQPPSDCFKDIGAEKTSQMIIRAILFF